MDFNISDVAEVLGIKPIRRTSGEVFAVCPFCNDRRGKFSYIIAKGNKKDMFHCFKCETGGSKYKLYALANGEHYDENKKAEYRKRILAELGQTVSIRPTYQAVEYISEEAEKADEIYCSKVYEEMLNILTLNDEHKADLERRGLNEKEIKYFKFKSTPKDKIGLCKKLMAKGYNLSGVPGFYVNKYGKWTMRISGDGYFCPVYSEKGVVGFQIRVDKPKNDAKYLWFSSAGCNQGVSSGGLITRLNGSSKIAILTEGILKATIIYCLFKGKVTVIGVPGINSIAGVKKMLKEEKNILVYEAYDMDKAINTEDKKEKEKTERISAAAEKLRNELSEINIPNLPLLWDMDEKGFWKRNHKGFDDFLFAHKEEVLPTFLPFLEKRAEKKLKILNYFS